VYERRELEAALAVWRRLIATAPDRSEYPIGYATARRQMRRFDEADAVLQPATTLFRVHKSCRHRG